MTGQVISTTSSLWIYLSWIALLSMANSLRADAAVISVVETMIGRTVSLPCSAIQHPNQPAPNLLLYYKTSSNIPFFSYDARSGDFWRDGSTKIRDDTYEGRVFLDLSEHRKASLRLKKVQLGDEGQITCRVDFLGSPSLTSIIDLRVYANPKHGPKITMKDVSSPARLITRPTIGPFYEGETINLSCFVVGGYPTPVVSWWQDEMLLDNSSQLISGKVNRVINDVKIGPLTRELVQSPLKCKSMNNPLTSSMEKTIYIKIHMAPVSILLPENPTVYADIEESLECRAVGAFPEANVSWSLDGRPLNFSAQETRQDGSVTISRIRFVAEPEDNGATISCTASSRTLQVPSVSSSATLNVTHAPIVWLRLGANLKVNEIRQGADVYFDCEIKANPPLYKISWYKNSEKVHHNKLMGVIVGGKNLVLQEVQRSDAGNYSCDATNAVGTTMSRTLNLSVQYAPMCSQKHQILTAVEGDVLTLECQVDAHPSNVTFFWLFNNTVDSTKFRKSEYVSEGAISKLKYVAYTARDYGTIYCWAHNVVATQSHPCSFALQPAGAPDSVRDCVLTNQSAGSLHITCKPGSDGGLTQSFRAEIFTSKSSESPVRVLEGMMPVFTVEGLAPGGDYVVRVTALNKKGASMAISLEAFTLKVAENRMISGVSSSSNPEDISDTGGGKELSPLVGIVAGVIIVIIIFSSVAVFATKRKYFLANRRTPDLVAGKELELQPSLPSSLSEISHTTKSNFSVQENHNELLEKPPIVQTSIVHSLDSMQRSDTLGGEKTNSDMVFTIPANIPPPPQYCAVSCNEIPSQQQLCSSSPIRENNYFDGYEPYQYPESTNSYQLTNPTSSINSSTNYQVPEDTNLRSHISSPHLYNSECLGRNQEFTERMSSPVSYVTSHPRMSVLYSSSEHLLEQTNHPHILKNPCLKQRNPMVIAVSSPSTEYTKFTQENYPAQQNSPNEKTIIAWHPVHDPSSYGFIIDDLCKDECAL